MLLVNFQDKSRAPFINCIILHLLYILTKCGLLEWVKPDAYMQKLTYLLFRKIKITKYLWGRVGSIASTTFWQWGDYPHRPHVVGAYGSYPGFQAFWRALQCDAYVVISSF